MNLLLRISAFWLLFVIALAACADEKIGKGDLDAQKEFLQYKIDSNRELVQKDLDGLKARIEAIDKRIDDQNTRTGDIGQSVDRFSVIVSIGGLLVTVLLAFGGLVGYFSVARKAADEARSASRKWFEDNQNMLATKICELERAAEQARDKIDTSVSDVEQLCDAAIVQIQNSLNAPNENIKPISDIEHQALHKNAAQIRDKPESSYSFEDWNTRAFDAYNSRKYEDAALFWKNASEIPNAGAANTAQALINRALAFDQLRRHHEAIAIYQQLIATYSSDARPVIRHTVAKAMNNLGHAQRKTKNPTEAIATLEHLIRNFSADRAPAIRDQVAIAMYGAGLALDDAQKPDDAIVRYDMLIATYSPDESPGMRICVASALNAKGFSRLLNAKKSWNNRELANSCLQQAEVDLLASLALRENCGITRGNIAYVQWLLGEEPAAERTFCDALASEDGDEKLYRITREDIEKYPIPEDARYSHMVERQWAAFQAQKTASKEA